MMRDGVNVIIKKKIDSIEICVRSNNNHPLFPLCFQGKNNIIFL